MLKTLVNVGDTTRMAAHFDDFFSELLYVTHPILDRIRRHKGVLFPLYTDSV